jgi:hypothetical protein
MTSPRAKGPHGFVPVTEPARAHPQRIPGRSHEKPVWPRGRAFDPVPVALVAAAYFGAATVGLSLAFVAEQVTAVWPPPGIGLAALLLFGSRAWPGIAPGAAIVHEKRTGRRARRPAPRDPGAGAPPRLSRGGGRQGPKVPARNGGSAAGTPVPRGERPDGERLLLSFPSPASGAVSPLLRGSERCARPQALAGSAMCPRLFRLPPCYQPHPVLDRDQHHAGAVSPWHLREPVGGATHPTRPAVGAAGQARRAPHALPRLGIPNHPPLGKGA